MPKTQVGRTQFWRSSRHYTGDYSVDVEVTGSFCLLAGAAPSSHLSSAVTASTGGKPLVPFCLWIFDFHRRQKGQELWNSIEGQNGNLFAWSNFLLYSDIWRPLPEQIRAIPSSSRGKGLPVLGTVSVNTGTEAQNNAAIEIDLWHLLCSLTAQPVVKCN